MIINCDYCGIEYDTKKHGAKYCSRPCMWADQREKRKAASEAKRKRICQWCGKEFIMHAPSGKATRGEVKEGLFCSRKCRGLNTRAKERKTPPKCKVYFKKCIECGAPFTGRFKNVNHCSDRCRYESHLAHLRERYEPKPKTKRICIICGKIFETSRRLGKTCSVFCRHKNNRLNKPGDYRERARFFGVEYEYINPIKVFRHNGWTCQICGKSTPQKNRGKRYSNAPELDHRIPMSRGGGHVYSNVQCACHKCNMVKSNKNNRGQMQLFEIKRQPGAIAISGS